MQHTDAKLNQFIQDNMQDIVFLLFIGHCCLLGKNNKEFVIDQYSTNCGIYLSRQENGKDYKNTLSELIKSGLNIPLDTSFENILKAFLQKNVNTKLSSLSENLRDILSIVRTLTKNKYKITNQIFNIHSLEFDADKLNSTKLSDKEIISHVERRRTRRLPDELQRMIEKNKNWGELYTWAADNDSKTTTTVKETYLRASKALQGYSRHSFRIGVALMVMAVVLDQFYPKNKEDTDDLPKQTSSLLYLKFNSHRLFFLMLIVIVSALLLTKFVSNSSIATSVKSYKGGDNNYDSLDKALMEFFKLQLVEYRVLDADKKVLTERVQSFKLAPKMDADSKDNYSGFQNESNDENDHTYRKSGKLPRPEKKYKIVSTRTFELKKVDKDSKSKQSSFTSFNAHETTPTHLIRYRTIGNVSDILVFNKKKLEKEIPDKITYDIFVKNFKKGEKCIKVLTNKRQAEITSGCDGRIFGERKIITEQGSERVYSQKESLNGKEVIEFNKYRDGLH